MSSHINRKARCALGLFAVAAGACGASGTGVDLVIEGPIGIDHLSITASYDPQPVVQPVPVSPGEPLLHAILAILPDTSLTVTFDVSGLAGGQVIARGISAPIGVPARTIVAASLRLVLLGGAGGGPDGVGDGGGDPDGGVVPGDGGDCSMPTTSDVDHCGACQRACSSAHVQARGCAGGACEPACATPYSDCSRPASPNPDDGCETNGKLDPGEPDNACSGQGTNTKEGSTTTISAHRILPLGDVDTFTVNLAEGTHFCVSGTQDYRARVTLNAPDGSLALFYQDSSACGATWSARPSPFCIKWQGICLQTDDLTRYLQVRGTGPMGQSCSPYTLSIHYCTLGESCGCP